MQEFKIYSISDAYIQYLREKFPNVYSNKEENRLHTRKYTGIALKINNFAYYIPLSSPKKTDFQIAGETKVIKKSIVPIYRIVVKKSNGEKELKATLRISHMIPVPESELILYDLEHESDQQYKNLVRDEIIFIRKHAKKIRANAELLYRQKKARDQTARYVSAALDFQELEKVSLDFFRV